MKGELLEAYVALSKAWTLLDFKLKEQSEKKKAAIREILTAINELQDKIYMLREEEE